MFTGIIESIGTVEKKTKNSLAIKAPDILPKLNTGASVAVDGVCLTVTKMSSKSFEADVMPVTLERTILGERKVGGEVNLELAMLGSKRFEGHVVSGHVEGVAELLTMKIVENAYHLTFKVPEGLTKYIVKTGSVALNGISLTVMEILDDQLMVGIIPHTWDNTNLQHLEIGDKVNLETDLMAKYAEKLFK